MLEAVLFDKDGTLVDFHGTWDKAVGQALRATATDENSLRRAAELIDFDLDGDSIRPTSPLIAESNDVIGALLESVLDIDLLFSIAVEATLQTVTAAVGLPDVLYGLGGLGLRLCVVTNDYEAFAAQQLHALGWADLFAHVVGADSGFGAKPEPSLIHGALALLDVDATQAVIVGDTAHDLRAGRAAGIHTVLVTNGCRPEPRVTDLADVVVDSLEGLLSALQRAGLT